MIHLYILIGILSATHGIHGTSFGSSTSKDLKQPVNYAGKLTTHQGQEYIVDNISIDNKCKDIPMYDKPITHADAVINNDTKRLEIKLEIDPTNDITTKLNLNDIKTISVPSPDIIWWYQKKERYAKQEFIEVVVTRKSNTKESYLLNPKTPIYCDEIDPTGPQEKIVRLLAIDTLSIEGFSYRDVSKKTGSNECPPCSAQNNK